MKKQFVLAMLVFASVGIFAQNKKNDVQKDELRGNVKSVRTIMYDIKKTNKQRKETISTAPDAINILKNYDKKGNMTEGTVYIQTGELDHYNKNIYDDKGNLVEEKSIYSNNNFVAEKTSYRYDKHHFLIEKNYQSFEGIPQRKYIFKNNEKGLLLELEYFYNGVLTEKDKYQYDKQGNLVLELSYDEKGNLKNKIGYVYNSKGLKTKTIVYDINHPSKAEVTWITDFNKEGDEVLVYSAEKKSDKNTACYDYKYDKKHNWIEKKIYEKCLSSKSEIAVIKRTISYY